MNWKGTEGPGRQARFGLGNLDNPSETQKAMRKMEEGEVMNKMKRSTNLSAAIPNAPADPGDFLVTQYWEPGDPYDILEIT